MALYAVPSGTTNNPGIKKLLAKHKLRKRLSRKTPQVHRDRAKKQREGMQNAGGRWRAKAPRVFTKAELRQRETQQDARKSAK